MLNVKGNSESIEVQKIDRLTEKLLEDNISFSDQRIHRFPDDTWRKVFCTNH